MDRENAERRTKVEKCQNMWEQNCISRKVSTLDDINILVHCLNVPRVKPEMSKSLYWPFLDITYEVSLK